jgi:hypothetical protein
MNPEDYAPGGAEIVQDASKPSIGAGTLTGTISLDVGPVVAAMRETRERLDYHETTRMARDLRRRLRMHAQQYHEAHDHEAGHSVTCKHRVCKALESASSDVPSISRLITLIDEEEHEARKGRKR